jgi:hypothetical protein
MAVLEILIVIGGVVGFTCILTGLTFVVARRAAARMSALDARLRPIEAETGKCAVCDGAGSRIEVITGPHSVEDAIVTCFRCGGTGLPLPPGETSRLILPSPGGFQLRQIVDDLERKGIIRSE